MLYGDNELQLWWRRLSESERTELFERAIEAAEQKMRNRDLANFYTSLKSQWDLKKSLSPGQLVSLRKWHRD